jgi:hypothetical protein
MKMLKVEVEAEEDYKLPKWIKELLCREHIWFFYAIFFGLVALWIAWEQKQCAVNFNALADMYNAQSNSINFSLY